MVKFLKPGKAVILLQGRYAGKKAVIVRAYDDGTKDHAFGHCLICGLSKEPRKVIKAQGVKKQARRSSLKSFVKLVNYNHITPTRYTLDVDLKTVVTPDALEGTKRVEANKEAKKLLEEKFKTGKNRWFFSKLCF